MARSEDYLDSLLNALNQTPNDNIKSDRESKPTARPESRFLRDFERELEEEFGSDNDSDFVREFERELGIDSEIDDLDDFDTNDSDFFSNDLDFDLSPKASPVNDILEDISTPDTKVSLDSDISNDSNASINSQDDDLMAGLANILDSSAESDANSNDTAIPTESNPTPEPEDDGIMSDIEDESTIEPESSEPEQSGEDTQTDSQTETQADTENENESESTGESGEVSSEEILDIGNLLDSIDDEGNIELPPDGQTVAVDENGNPIDTVSKESDEKPQEEEKVGFLKKLLGKLFKKKDKEESEEDEETQEETNESEEAEGDVEEEVDPKAAKAAAKAAKKEEKERKKKEKEEAKKAAAAAKAEAKKNKPPKTKKPKKKKEPDNSPKIPIKVILLFLILAGSMIALWFIYNKAISYEITIKSAQSSFDKEEYLDCYSKLAGTELRNEDDMILLNRARLMATLEMRYKSFNVYNGKTDIKALDSLVRGAVYYADHQSEAEEMGIPSEFDSIGRKIVQSLSDTYGVSEADANTLVEMKIKAEYTKELYRILERQGLWSLERR